MSSSTCTACSSPTSREPFPAFLDRGRPSSRSGLTIVPKQQRALQQESRNESADVRGDGEMHALLASDVASHPLYDDPSDCQPKNIDPAVEPQVVRHPLGSAEAQSVGADNRAD